MKYMTSFNDDGNHYDRLDNVEFVRNDYQFICKYNEVDESVTVIFYTDVDSPELRGNILSEIENIINLEVGRDEQSYATQN